MLKYLFISNTFEQWKNVYSIYEESLQYQKSFYEEIKEIGNGKHLKS